MAPLEKPASVARLPVASTASRKIGTPIGTVIASACSTDPVSTPRRALPLLNANVAADSAASREHDGRARLLRPHRGGTIRHELRYDGLRPPDRERER